jgi:hypothetical protein
MLLGGAAAVALGVMGAATAGADPHGTGSGPSPFGGLSCTCPGTAPAGSPARTQAITRGIQEGLAASAPAPALSSKLLR